MKKDLPFSINSELLDKLACPSCFMIHDCKSETCAGECIKACKSSSISIKNKIAVIDGKICINCGLCALACPQNSIDRLPLSFVEYNNEYSLYCNNCKTIYPFKDIVYITEKCDIRKCDQECIKSCDKKAIIFPELFFNYHSKHLKIDKNCNYCGKCAKVCPENALVSIKTPFLYPGSINPFSTTYDGNFNLNYISESKEIFPFQDILREFNSDTMSSASFLTNKYLLSELEKHKADVILDNGCGSNNFKVILEQSGIKTIGIDIGADRNAYMPIQLITNGEYLPFMNNSVNVLTSNFVLEHTSNPKNYLKEVYRVLSHKGLAFISVPTPYFHLAYALKGEGYKKYGMHVLKNFKDFVKNPIKDFLVERAHEKDWNIEGTKKNVTFIDEIRRWKIEIWEKMYREAGFNVMGKKITGNILSLYSGTVSRKLGNTGNIGVHCTHILEK